MIHLDNHMTQPPPLFLERLESIIPAHLFKDVIKQFSCVHPTVLRANTLKVKPSELLDQLIKLNIQAERVDEFENAFIIPNEQRELLTFSQPFQQGLCYIQNLSSQLAPIVLDPKPGEEILDLTAAPGSKTTQIAALMNDTGRIAAVEKIKSRFFRLKDNCEQQGTSCVDFYCKDGSTVWRSCPNRFDRVLLDAPCSSEGRFDFNDEKTFQYWNEKKIRDMAYKQWKLLYSAFQSLKPGGTLVYSTCTFAPEENEIQIAKLIKKFGDAVLIDPVTLPFKNIQSGLSQWKEKSLPQTINHAIRILPNNMMSGFFICRIKKGEMYC